LNNQILPKTLICLLTGYLVKKGGNNQIKDNYIVQGADDKLGQTLLNHLK